MLGGSASAERSSATCYGAYLGCREMSETKGEPRTDSSTSEHDTFKSIASHFMHTITCV